MSPEPIAHVEREIASQPAAWRAVVDLASQHAAALPPAGARVAVVGCGTSFFMAGAWALLRESAGAGETDAFAASEFPFGRSYDHVIAITRSGTTTEIVELLEQLDPSVTTTVVTAFPDTAAPKLATHVIHLSMAVEQAVVQTVFPTTLLAMVRAGLGESLDDVIAAAEVAITAELPFDPSDVSQITFVGRGWAARIADEAALKCRESASFWAESYPALEYRHGPISVSDPGTAVWLFGPEPANFAADVAVTGTRYVHSGDDPLVELIRAQRMAVGLARRFGRDPDQPRALSYSVILDDA